MAITLKTDKQGLAIIDRARINKSWTALAIAWCNQANVSLSTLKRFREKKAIQKDAFIAICQAVGIEDWQQIVSGSASDVSVLQRRYQQSKRVIAEEVLSNLDSLDARLAFVAQAFSDDPAEVQRQSDRLHRAHASGQDRQRAYPLQREQGLSIDANATDVRTGSHHCSIRIEANVSIIQIMMEI